ncbi:NADH dehydrogenase [ubiquinone] 1 alpha subcomplex assembly factor 2 isoform X6 [Saimiri boliviensis]|uniref:NADH dehydrogenase [ubiquinone] 1 alpha subcomplex assembly factor 2 isoform X6 n=1 Tax=Saimiri boliviensis TaxID=27679 RepID=UPI003D773765
MNQGIFQQNGKAEENFVIVMEKIQSERRIAGKRTSLRRQEEENRVHRPQELLTKNFQTWIRRKRKTPPTMEEILKNEKYREEIKIKSQEFYEKEKLLSKETNEELLTPPVDTHIKGHASAPYFGKEEPSVAPSSTGKTYQPGSWMPQDGKSPSQ